MDDTQLKHVSAIELLNNKKVNSMFALQELFLETSSWRKWHELWILLWHNVARKRLTQIVNTKWCSCREMLTWGVKHIVILCIKKLWKDYRLVVIIEYFINECRDIIVKLHVVMSDAFCLWFANVMWLVLLLSFFKAGECCRRDALNFSHHRMTPKGVFDMTSLLCRVALHCPNLFIVYRFID